MTSRRGNFVIRYSPPKSQVWGHQVGRLSAGAIVERSTAFLGSQCTIINSQPSELMIGWNAGQDEALVEVLGEIDQALGRPTTVNERASAGAELFRQRRWPFGAESLRAVAGWFDRLAALLKTREVVAQSSTFWVFAWRGEAVPLRPLESAGGMFGIHLGRPHRITTVLSFRDLEQYETIKAALAELDLVELSDRHLRPKIGAMKAKRRVE
jgi:hypothetical protein